MKMTCTNASLFGPAFPTFDAAKNWIAAVQSGEITAFSPIHGKVAGYHVEMDDRNVPVQKFDPPIKPETDVRIVKLNHSGNISIVPDKDDANIACFFPHINADVEYEAAEAPPVAN
jgi:hypothetical protein